MSNKVVWLFGVIISLYVGGMVMNFFDKRPFKFEDFETSQSLKTFLENRYPIRSDGDIALKDLELAGAKCELTSKEDRVPIDFKKYPYLVWCDYRTGWFAWPPKEHYQVIIMGDHNRNIIEFSVGIYRALFG